MAEHFIVKCQNCGSVVEQCKCMDAYREERWVPSCPACDGSTVPSPSESQSTIWAVQSYDRRMADTGPASRLKNVAPSLKSAEREIERAKGILHGLVREMEMVAKHTHDRTIQDNFKHVNDFSDRLDGIDTDIDKLLSDLEKFSRGYR